MYINHQPGHDRLTWWIEDESVAKRAIQLWGNIDYQIVVIIK